MHKLSILFWIIFLGPLYGCSSLEFHQEGVDQFAIATRADLTRVEVKAGECDIYLWGLYPKDCNLDFQKEFVGFGLDDPSLVRVSNAFTLTDVLISVVTLGFYTPVSYEISVYTKQEKR